MNVYGDEIEEVRKYKPLKDVLCDKCGKSILVPDWGMTIKGGTFHASFGYGSRHDTQDFDFTLCDDCSDDLMDLLKYNTGV